jgi:hypothetical protein
MARAQKQLKREGRVEMSGVERLGLRVSSMINHPVAQAQRWVKVHRLDVDGDREWDEVMGLLSATDGIEMTFNDEDESVTLRWEADPDAELPAAAEDAFETEESAPF